jgi:hypothetical protein
MRISVNLATRPFIELRPLFARLRLAMGLRVVALYVPEGKAARPTEILFSPRDAVVPIFNALKQHTAGSS